MRKSIVFVLLFILAGAIIAYGRILNLKADITIYIRADGSIEPVIAPISTVDNITYVFTDNISASMIIERDNITIYSGGYVLAGGMSITNLTGVTITDVNIDGGISVSDSRNLTIRNAMISSGISLSASDSIVENATLYRTGIWIRGSNNLITKNHITGYGSSGGASLLKLDLASDNVVADNTIINSNPGMWSVILSESSNNRICRNVIRGADIGLQTDYYPSDGNVISENNITDNGNGIILNGGSNNNVSFNNFINNGQGIKLYSDSNIVSHNTVIYSAYDGIVVLGSGNAILDNDVGHYYSGAGITIASAGNNITGNNVVENNAFGMRLSSCNNTLRDNSIANNGQSFELFCNGDLANFINDVDASNTIDGKPIYYWVNRQNATIPPDAGYVALVNCSKIVVTELNLTNNDRGLLLAFSTDSTAMRNNFSGNYVKGIWIVSSSNITLSGNNMTYNYDGIVLDDSDNVKIIGNNILSSSDKGVVLASSSNCTVYYNNFLNPTNGWVSGGANDVWDNGYPSGGNYWSDYVGKNIQGIGYPPYNANLGGAQDNYPLMGLINIFDAGNWNNESQEIAVISNLTVTNFQSNALDKLLSFEVTEPNQTIGFCRVAIPKHFIQDWWQSNCSILVNGNSVQFENLTDTNNIYLYFTFQNTEGSIIIVPEFQSCLILTMLTAALLIETTILKRRRTT